MDTKLKKILYIILFAVISTSAYVLGDLYTKKQIDNLINYASYPYYWQVRERGPALLRKDIMVPLTIERLLYFNRLAVIDWDKREQEEMDYKNWVKKVIKNPILIEIAINKYANYSLRKLNSNIERNLIQDSTSCSHITKEVFWQGQKLIFDYYMFSVDKLLALYDEDLNYYVESNLGGEASYEFSNWWNEVSIDEFDKKIPNTNIYLQRHGPYVSKHSTFPGDLFLLTKRMTENSSYTPREFLLNVQKIGKKLEKYVKELEYWK